MHGGLQDYRIIVPGHLLTYTSVKYRHDVFAYVAVSMDEI